MARLTCPDETRDGLATAASAAATYFGISGDVYFHPPNL